MKLLLLNGPNLNLLGKREPGIYGDRSFEEFLHALRKHYPEHDLDHCQSNVEGELVNALQAADSLYVGVVFNAGGYTHTSVAAGLHRRDQGAGDRSPHQQRVEAGGVPAHLVDRWRVPRHHLRPRARWLPLGGGPPDQPRRVKAWRSNRSKVFQPRMKRS